MHCKPSKLLFLLTLFVPFVDVMTSPYTCKQHEGCYCVNLPIENGDAVKKWCCCSGESVMEIPRNLSIDVETLALKNVGLTELKRTDFLRYWRLEVLTIFAAPNLVNVSAEAFAPLRSLRKLRIYGCPKLTEITGVLLLQNPVIKILQIRESGLVKLPYLQMADGKEMLDIVITQNKISTIYTGNIVNVVSTMLDLSDNGIIRIEAHAFNDSQIGNLILKNNMELEYLDDDVFKGIENLYLLDVQNTAISKLPTDGLNLLQKLNTQNAKNLKEFPPITRFSSLVETKMHYAYHCCLFDEQRARPEIQKALEEQQQTRSERYKRLFEKWCDDTTKSGIVATTPSSRKKRAVNATTIRRPSSAWGRRPVMVKSAAEKWRKKTRSDQGDMGEWANRAVTVNRTMVFICDDAVDKLVQYYTTIKCTPKPDALNPCEDVMGYLWLRYLIWAVWIGGLLANVGVILVLAIVNHPRMRVHHFFMGNLALADIALAIYLAMLAVVDVITQNRYYNYAVEWQTGLGCQIAGVLCLFGTELAVVSMFLVSFEIWYNTKYIFYGRRLTLRMAICLMGIGWLFSIVMSVMPLMGVSTYSSTSTCLPLRMEGSLGAKIFFAAGLIVMLLAFAGITANYISIYCSVAVKPTGSPSTRGEDLQVAKKMLLLISTNFICWAPTIFFGLTSLVRPLISISATKVLLVVFFPLNSLLNPFLYVYLTKTIRQELYSILTRRCPRLIRIYDMIIRSYYRLIRLLFWKGKSRSPSDPWYESMPPKTSGGGARSGTAESKRKGSRHARLRRAAYRRLPTISSLTGQPVTQSTSLASSPRNSHDISGHPPPLILLSGPPPTGRARHASGPGGDSSLSEERSRGASMPLVDDRNYFGKRRSFSLESEPPTPTNSPTCVFFNFTHTITESNSGLQLKLDSSAETNKPPSIFGAVWPPSWFTDAKSKRKSFPQKKGQRFQPRMSDISEHSQSSTASNEEDRNNAAAGGGEALVGHCSRKWSAVQKPREQLQRISENEHLGSGDVRRSSVASKGSMQRSVSLSDLSDRFDGDTGTASSSSSVGVSVPTQPVLAIVEQKTKVPLRNHSSDSGYFTSQSQFGSPSIRSTISSASSDGGKFESDIQIAPQCKNKESDTTETCL